MNFAATPALTAEQQQDRINRAANTSGTPADIRADIAREAELSAERERLRAEKEAEAEQTRLKSLAQKKVISHPVDTSAAEKAAQQIEVLRERLAADEAAQIELMDSTVDPSDRLEFHQAKVINELVLERIESTMTKTRESIKRQLKIVEDEAGLPDLLPKAEAVAEALLPILPGPVKEIHAAVKTPPADLKTPSYVVVAHTENKFDLIATVPDYFVAPDEADIVGALDAEDYGFMGGVRFPATTSPEVGVTRHKATFDISQMDRNRRVGIGSRVVGGGNA